MRGRADIYIGFFEAGLRILRDDGALAFLCSDRWMRNSYGTGLRNLVAEQYSLDLALEVHDVDVFESRVAVYPSIAIITKRNKGVTLLGKATASFDEQDARRFSALFRGGVSTQTDTSFQHLWLRNGELLRGESWPALGTLTPSALISLADRFPTLEDSGITIGSGVATGSDDVFFTSDPNLVEPERLSKIVGPADLNGQVRWKGQYLVNPWDGDELVDLEKYPRLKGYFDSNKELLENRYVAKNHPDQWWRTIDRPHWDRYLEPKLLLPDLKQRVTPTLDLEGFVPKHTLYFMRSAVWDLEVLGAILMSDLVNAQVEAYSVKFASGRMRVSGQYLRKVRLPERNSISTTSAEALRRAFLTRDYAAINQLVVELYST